MPRRDLEPIVMCKYEPDMDRQVAALMVLLGIEPDPALLVRERVSSTSVQEARLSSRDGEEVTDGNVRESA